MKNRAEELVGRMSQLVEPAEDWHEIGSQDEPAFTNSWTNRATWNTAGYYKHNGRVYLKGVTDSGTNGTSAFTLPEGYRPPVKEQHVTRLIGGAMSLSHITINADGTVVPITGNTDGNVLDGISFRVG